MENTPNHNEYIFKQEKALFAQLEVPYTKSKETVWQEMAMLLGEEAPKASAKVISLNWKLLSVAASVALLVASVLFMKFHTTTLTTSDQVANLSLPDGSEVQLNTNSTLSYAPYWWSFSRAIHLEGEAFFEVEKGEKFAVFSTNGTTEVLGTSFNIYARETEYQVLCKTGKVKVTDKQSKHVFLTKNEFAKLENNLIVKSKEANSTAILAWKSEKFDNVSTSLSSVFEEIEKHYDIKLELDIKNIEKRYHTSLFDKNKPVDKVLEIICFNFDLEVERKGDKTFIIRSKK